MIQLLSLEKVLKEFEVEPKTIETKKKVYLVTTVQGKYVLRKIPTRDRAKFIAKVLEFYCQKGFKEIKIPVRSSKGDPYYALSSKVYMLFPWSEGCELTRWNGQDIAQAMGWLSRFHEFGGYHKGGKLETKRHLVRNLVIWRTNLERLEKKVYFSSPNIWGEDIYDYLENEVLNGHKALKELSQLIVSASGSSGRIGICHGDYLEHNLIFESGRLVGVIDFEYCHYGPQIIDLARYITCFCNNHGWSTTTINQILNRYFGGRAPEHDAKLLAISLTFPRGLLFWLDFSKQGIREKEYAAQRLIHLANIAKKKSEVINKTFY